MLDFLFGALFDEIVAKLPYPLRVAIYTTMALLLVGLFVWIAFR